MLTDKHDLSAMMAEILSGYALLACWGADRLDLGRVGIIPEPNRLCTDAARDLLLWADYRATNGHVPAEVLVGWGLSDTDKFMFPDRI